GSATISLGPSRSRRARASAAVRPFWASDPRAATTAVASWAYQAGPSADPVLDVLGEPEACGPASGAVALMARSWHRRPRTARGTTPPARGPRGCGRAGGGRGEAGQARRPRRALTQPAATAHAADRERVV